MLALRKKKGNSIVSDTKVVEVTGRGRVVGCLVCLWLGSTVGVELVWGREGSVVGGNHRKKTFEKSKNFVRCKKSVVHRQENLWSLLGVEDSSLVRKRRRS